MDHPPPHAFSRSPVEEVFCRVTLGPGAESLSLAIPPPYPGWPHIRERIRDMIADAGEISRITGCTLRYTDLFFVASAKKLPGIEEIGQILSGKFNCYLHNAQEEIVIVSVNIPDTIGSVRSMYNMPGKPGWTLIFTMHTEVPARFVSCDSVMIWFDDARTEIHEIFDLIVPEEIVQLLR